MNFNQSQKCSELTYAVIGCFRISVARSYDHAQTRSSQLIKELELIEDNGTIQFSLGILGDKVLLIKTTKRDRKKPREKKK